MIVNFSQCFIILRNLQGSFYRKNIADNTLAIGAVLSMTQSTGLVMI